MQPSWFENGVLNFKAYRRKHGKDDDGLSVVSSHELAITTIKKGRGVASLQITAITALNLQFVPEGDEHGLIIGIPFDDGEDYDLAMDLADKLVEFSHVTPILWDRSES